MPVIVKCVECGKAFSVQNKRIKTAKFCSKNCLNKFNNKIKYVNNICLRCGETYVVLRSYSKHRKYCSLKCSPHLQIFISKGEKFNLLTAIKKTKQMGEITFWLFRCDCGNEKEINYHSVRYGAIKSCGCLRFAKADNIAGQKFGKLTAIKRVANRGKKTFWLFRCDCGNEKELNKTVVVRGDSKSCGCLKVAKTSYLIGQKFGSLTAIKHIGQRKPRRTLYWLFRCDCGNKKEISISQVKSSANPNCGCLTLRRVRGVKHWFKKHSFITHSKIAKLAKGTFSIKQWREKLEYYGNACYLCKEPLENKIVHKEHRIPLSKGGTNWIANVAPACADCNLSKRCKTEKEFKILLLNRRFQKAF
ncbi:MAG: HNH endonuclease [Acidobacteriota bacterium]|nr:HNH endonuclease [Acidobacteriota bacterium]